MVFLKALRGKIMNLLDVHNMSLSDNYFGMPSDIGVLVSGAFKYLKDRVWEGVQEWMEQSLSGGGMEILIKVVAQVTPTYSMSRFKLPRGLCEHVNSVLRNFWRGSKEGKRKTCWVAWEGMTKPKLCGGLGFRDIELYDLAPLARQAWRILHVPDSLSACVLSAVYYPQGGFLGSGSGSTSVANLEGNYTWSAKKFYRRESYEG